MELEQAAAGAGGKAAEGTGITIDDLSDDEVRMLLSTLGPQEVARVELAWRRAWRLSSLMESWWAKQLSDVFGVESASEAAELVGRRGAAPLATSREAYGALSGWAGRYAPGHTREASLIGRAVRAVRVLRDCIPIPRVVASLNTAWEGRGATEAQLDELERCLEVDERERSTVEVRLPEAMRALLRVCNGQAYNEQAYEPEVEFTVGCFGGYTVYGTFVNTRLLGCSKIEAFAPEVQKALFTRCWNPARLSPSEAMHYVPIAASVRMNRPLLVDCKSGAVLLAGFSLEHLVPATPPDAGQADAVLRWVEEFAGRLANRRFGAEPVGRLRGIEMEYLRTLPHCVPGRWRSEVVTKALRVTFSAALTDIQTHHTQGIFAWTYSLEMALLCEDEQAALRPEDMLDTVQLKSRHWRIKRHDGSVERVDGDAVIGLYPTLHRPAGDGSGGDSKPFVYQSRTVVEYSDAPGAQVPSMGGHFRFVKGTLERPTGDFFDAICGEIFFDLEGFHY